MRTGTGAADTIEEWIGAHAAGLRPVVIADATVAALYPDLLRAIPRIVFPSGEAFKSREQWAALTDLLLDAGHDRRTLIIAFGGGVTTDLAGFVAATFLRGVAWIAVPTTTLAMIDASVGGKTGVDTRHGKNLVGAFHQPRAVFADPAFLATLPREHLTHGLAEAVKHAAIASLPHWERLEREAEHLLARDLATLEAVIAESVAIKADVVRRDERESGLRAILNFGHTVGHALEHASDYRLPHGAAVALGLIGEARVGEFLGITASGTVDRIAALLSRLELPVTMPILVDHDRIAKAARQDKKNTDGQVRTVLLSRLGEVARTPEGGWTHPVDLDTLLG